MEIAQFLLKVVNSFKEYIIHTVLSLIISILSIAIFDEDFFLVKKIGRELFTILVFLTIFLICLFISYLKIQPKKADFSLNIDLKNLSVGELHTLFEFYDTDTNRFTSDFITPTKFKKEYTSLYDRNILVRNDFISVGTAYHLSKDALKHLNRPIIKKKIINLFTVNAINNQK